MLLGREQSLQNPTHTSSSPGPHRAPHHATAGVHSELPHFPLCTPKGCNPHAMPQTQTEGAPYAPQPHTAPALQRFPIAQAWPHTAQQPLFQGEQLNHSVLGAASMGPCLQPELLACKQSLLSRHPSLIPSLFCSNNHENNLQRVCGPKGVPGSCWEQSPLWLHIPVQGAQSHWRAVRSKGAAGRRVVGGHRAAPCMGHCMESYAAAGGAQPHCPHPHSVHTYLCALSPQDAGVCVLVSCRCLRSFSPHKCNGVSPGCGMPHIKLSPKQLSHFSTAGRGEVPGETELCCLCFLPRQCTVQRDAEVRYGERKTCREALLNFTAQL